MNKNEFISTIADQTNFSKADVKKILDATFETITASLSQGTEVSVNGFGKFKVNERAARQGRNPKTGETIQIAASKVAKFSPSKTLKDALNN